MSKMMLDIPKDLTSKVDSYLAWNGLDHRDKSRFVLAVLREQMTKDLPEGLEEQCRVAKEQIRERAKQRRKKCP